MATYAELKAMTPEQRAQVWETLPDEQKLSILQEREAARAATNPPTTTAGDAASRGMLQGLTFGLSEELGSLSRILPGGESPQEYRDRKRAEMERMQQEQPEAYLGGEIGGAVAGSMIPLAGWLTGPARAARAATLPGRIASTVGRGAIVGGADAGLQAAGRAEGGLERLGPGMEAVPAGAAFGAVAGPAGEFLLAPALGAITRQFGRSASVSVERNVRQIAESTGMPVDEVLRRISAGQPLAGMNDTTRMAARAIKNLDPVAGQQMIEATGPRLDRAVENAVTDVKTALVGPDLAAAPNLRAVVEPQINTQRVEAGERLNAARASAGDVSDDTMAFVLDVAQRAPNIADQINATLRTRGAPPLFKKTPQGVRLLRRPTVEEAEMLDRTVGDAASSAYRGTGGLIDTARGEALEAARGPLRAAVDADAPQLGPLREGYADLKTAQTEGYPLGLRSRSTAPDVFSIELDKLGPSGPLAARAGTAVRIGEDVGKSRRNTSLIDEMIDPGRYLGGNLDTLAPGQINRTPEGPLGIAQSEGRLLDALTGNSTTAAQAEAMSQLKGGVDAFRGFDRLGTTGPWEIAVGVLRSTLGSQTGLDEQGLRTLADLMMKGGPEAEREMAKILDPDLARQIMNLFRTELSAGRAARGAAGAAGGSETDPAGRIMEEVPSLMDIMGGVP